MNQLIEYLTRLFSSWKFWIVIPPWDRGVRVRLGRNAKLLEPGLHFRVPALDDITLVNTRLRMCTTPTQTLPAHGSRTRCLSITVGYRIMDPRACMLAYSSPEPVVMAFIQARIANDGGSFDQVVCLEDLRQHVRPAGIEVEFAYTVEDVEVRTYRLLNNSGGLYSGAGSGVSFGAPPPPTY